MILLKFLGLLDFLTAIILLLFQYDVASWRPFVALTLYLFAKSIMLKGGFASFLDFAIAFYMVIMLFHPFAWISWIAAIYLIQKSATSFFA